ncbi:hypothetical protein [Microseira sp. BLCC-F43]|uniref:hypothetical protein n=1 Tax=Microseira sp. BLCC-F43 TaxID=3153602 RepID=UPI0035B74558
MSFVDCLLMTLFNAAFCIALPKVIFLMQQEKANRRKQSQLDYVPEHHTTKVPSFP